MKELIDITSYEGEGYRPVVDYGSFRVAILNYCDELLPEELNHMQKHDETDEVFVLLRGRCILFIGEPCEEGYDKIRAYDMEPFKEYNIKKGVFHTHTLNQEGMVLIVENRDTGDWNSPKVLLSEKQRETVRTLTKGLWQEKK